MKKILDFLDKERLCVVSSVNSAGNPESALVAFSETDDLEILIGTSSKSRKYKNIQGSNNVSLVFGFSGEKTLQYEGVVKLVDNDDIKQKIERHLQKNPGAKKYHKDPSQKYMMVSPKWARLTKSDPEIIEEVKFS